jgi:hypothetical protein
VSCGNAPLLISVYIAHDEQPTERCQEPESLLAQVAAGRARYDVQIRPTGQLSG